jgi:hypothetical protein
MRTRAGSALLTALLGILLLARCECRHADRGADGLGAGSTGVFAELLFLPSEDKTRVSLTRDSTGVERLNAADSVLSDTIVAHTGRGREHYDSLLGLLAEIPAGEYRKDHVIDGSRILLRHAGKEVLCDNCLHDYVLEAVGVPPGHISRSVSRIKEAVRHVNEMVTLAEGGHDRTWRRVEVVVGGQGSGDTASDYEVDTIMAAGTDSARKQRR